MKVSTRTSTTGRAKAVEPVEPHRTYDILGVALLALALLTVLSLLLTNTGIVGRALGGFLTGLFGRGAWAAPVLLGGVGLALLRGRRSIEVTHLTWGLTLIFLSVIAAFAQPVAGDYFDPDAVATSGGYVGAILGWSMSALLGQARVVGLGAVGMVGLILCLNVPLRTALSRGAERARRPLRRPSAVTHGDPNGRVTRRAAVTMEEPETVPVNRRMPPWDDPKEEATPDPVPAGKAKPKPIVRETVAAGSPTLDIATAKEGYQLPPLGLLAAPPDKPKRTQQEMQKNIETLEGTLEQFGIDATVVEVATGPTITRYEIQLGPGIRVARITALADNIAMNLAASQVRVEAPIPGKAAIGVEVPNSKPTMVALREVCDTKEFLDHPSRLSVALGQDVSGLNKYADLTKMPHLLIGGATNSGKSIGLASIITSLLMRNTPKDLRLVMIDPKRVELTLFDRIPHLMCPVIKDVKEAPGVLRAVWREMDRRYDMLSEHGVRNIQSWNERAIFQDRLPYIVVIIDELADLMIQAAAEVETSICRLAQLARAVGIHLVIATQRPSVDVITGTIKANIASRIAFTVSSQIDSRTILDQKGAESLIGRGDMLFLPIDAAKPVRIQGCYVGEKEIEAVCEFWRAQQAPEYVLEPIEEGVADAKKEGGDFGEEAADPFWEDAVRWVVDRGQASTSMLQRRFSIGFQRASRLLDTMEERGIVGPRDGPRPREVLVSPMDVDALFGKGERYDTGWVGDD